MRSRLLAPLLSLVLAVLALSAVAQPARAAASFTLQGSIEQLMVLDATPGTTLELVTGDEQVVDSGTVDAQGSLMWRDLRPGTYTVRDAAEDSDAATAQVVGYGAPAPAQAFYDGQTIDPGFGYLETRDGTTLSVNVVTPAGTGPFPTVVEYSGYTPSRPDGGNAMATLFTSLGYAYVGVNIRGTGCSGGSFRNFEPVQSLDGYDAIEAIAAQPWVRGKVGMIGVSYPGISQLYAARTQPPHLGAIAPLSVISDTYRGTLYPGGILNTGFAVPWAAERAAQAAPYGQGWTQDRADGGDTVCADNQRLRLQNPDPLQLIKTYDTYVKRIYDEINPSLFAGRIDVPVFTAGTWQDEQTGGYWPTFLGRFSGTPRLYATVTNGVHVESIVSNATFDRLVDFLDLYVARTTPHDGLTKALIGSAVAEQLTGVEGVTPPPVCDRGVRSSDGQPCRIDYTGLTYRQAKKRFEKTQGVRVLFEEGAAPGQEKGAPAARFEATFPRWPVPEADAWRLFLGARGTLQDRPVRQGPRKATPRSYTADADRLPGTTHQNNGDVWGADVDYDWRAIPKGFGLAWKTRPLPRTRVLVGSGSVDLWIKTRARDTDLEVTVTEVRPDGREVYVQSGWLRASHRRLAAGATTLRPWHTHRAADLRRLPKRGYAKVRVELLPFAHAFRKGSRIKLTLDAPGNSRPLWEFAETIADGEKVRVRADAVKRSRVVFSLVEGVDVPAGRPACGALRAQPCR